MWSSEEEVELASRFQRVVQEDHLARQQIFGHLDKLDDPKGGNDNDDWKMPAVETVDDQEDGEPAFFQVDDDDNEVIEEQQPNNNIAAASGVLLEDWNLRQQQLEEVHAFMNNPHGTLLNPHQEAPPVLDTNFNNDQVINLQPNRQMRDEFQAYCEHARHEFRQEFTQKQVRAIKLMNILKLKKAPLNAYDGIMEWHF